MAPKIKLVIFDLDGTLIDAYHAIVASFNFTMRKMHLPSQPFLTIKKAVGHGDESLLRPFVGKEKLKKALSIYRSHHQISLKTKSRLLPGTEKVLNYLKNKGLLLCVASNRPRKFSDIVLKHLDIYKYFDYILCADQIKKPKPDPEIIRQIMRKLSVSKEGTVYVGDMTVDILAGKRAKVKTFAVLTGSNSQKEIAYAKPDRLFKSVSGLINIL